MSTKMIFFRSFIINFWGRHYILRSGFIKYGGYFFNCILISGEIFYSNMRALKIFPGNIRVR